MLPRSRCDCLDLVPVQLSLQTLNTPLLTLSALLSSNLPLWSSGCVRVAMCRAFLICLRAVAQLCVDGRVRSASPKQRLSWVKSFCWFRCLRLRPGHAGSASVSHCRGPDRHRVSLAVLLSLMPGQPRPSSPGLTRDTPCNSLQQTTANGSALRLITNLKLHDADRW